MGLHLKNEVAVAKTPTIISNNPVYYDAQPYECQHYKTLMVAFYRKKHVVIFK